MSGQKWRVYCDNFASGSFSTLSKIYRNEWPLRIKVLSGHFMRATSGHPAKSAAARLGTVAAEVKNGYNPSMCQPAPLAYNLPIPVMDTPLFIVTGANGVGKSSIVPELARLLGREWHVFDLDLLADGYNYEVNWLQFKNNWLRLAAYLAQSGRATVLCGTMTPENVAECEARDRFHHIHYFGLHCVPEVLAARLRARGSFFATDEFIAQHQGVNHWAETAFESADTTNATPNAVAQRVRDWAIRLREASEPILPLS